MSWRRVRPAAPTALALAAALYLTLCWRPLYWGRTVPVDGNVITVTYPNWALARSLWESPRWPLWNPGRGMGVPHAADPVTSALYPPMLLLPALGSYLDFARAWTALHTALACFFAGAWMWRRRRDPWAAVAAGAAAGFNGFFTARVVFPHHFASAAWLPAALYFQEALSPAGVGVSLALQWLAGYPPFSLLTVFLLAAAASAQGREGPRCLARGGGLALGLASAQLFPFLEFLALSGRGAVLPARAAAQYSLSPAQLAKELLLPQWSRLSPLVQGDPAIVGFYLGLPALALAAWGARRHKALAAAAALAAVLCLGGNLPGYSRLAPLHIFRYPANWLFLTSAALAVLCGEGVARLPSERWKAAAAAAVTLDLLAFSQTPRVAWARPELLSDAPKLAELARRQPQPCRVYHDERLMGLWAAGSLESEEDYVLMRDFLAPDYGMALGLQGATDWQTLRLRSAEQYRSRLALRGPERDWAGTCLVVASDPAASRVERRSMRVFVNKNARERIFVPDDPGAQVHLEAYAPGFARARVRLARPGTVVFAENRYPGWRAAVDGNPSSIKAFAGTFSSIEVPAGEHEVAFRFMAWSFWFGFSVSLAAAAGLIRRKMW